MQAERTPMVDERRQFGARLPETAAAGRRNGLSDTPIRDLPYDQAISASMSQTARAALRERKQSQAAAGVFYSLPRHVRQAFRDDLHRGNAFLFAPVFMAAGALFYFTLRKEPAFATLIFCLIPFLGFALLSSARPAFRAGFLAAVMFFAGALAGKVETWLASTDMLGSEITSRLTGRVVRVEHQASGRVRLTLDILATERPTLRYAPQRVRATARSIPAAMKPGDVAQGVVRLMSPSGPVRPQSYDFAFKSYFSGIGASGFFLSGPEMVAHDSIPDLKTRIAARVENWRSRMASRIERQIGGAEGAVAAALITGVRAGIAEEINEALRITGLYHVISISGLHMALVAGTLMVALRAGFALFPSFAMRHPVKKYAAFVALCSTGFYLVMSGGDVAAQRSFIMLAVMLLAVIFDRAALTMRNLAISALIILVLAPHEVVGPSFQMSFAATAALVAGYSAWRHRRAGRPASSHAREMVPLRVLRSISAYIAGLSMTSIVAGLATALFTAWHFQQVSPLTLVANLAAMPIVSVVVMPMAVLASLAMPFGLDALPLWLMGRGIAAMNGIAIWLAQYSVFDATGAIPLAAVLILTAALAVLTMSESRLRWAALPLLVIGAAALMVREMPNAFISEDAALVALDLGDGRIAVNRPRPRAFTMDNWRRAFGNSEVLRPVKAEMLSGQEWQGTRKFAMEVFSATENSVRQAAPNEPRQASASGFICSDELCLARNVDGAIIAHAKNQTAAGSACEIASLIVIADPTADNPCRDGAATIVTARDLARRGSVEVSFQYKSQARNDIGGIEDQPRAAIFFAIVEPYRPWHAHRQFSRAARGLAPYQRRQQR